MEVGAVAFHDDSKVRTIHVEKNVSMVKQIKKTQTTRFPDLRELQELRALENRQFLKEERRISARKEKQTIRDRAEQENLRSYA